MKCHAWGDSSDVVLDSEAVQTNVAWYEAPDGYKITSFWGNSGDLSRRDRV